MKKQNAGGFQRMVQFLVRRLSAFAWKTDDWVSGECFVAKYRHTSRRVGGDVHTIGNVGVFAERIQAQDALDVAYVFYGWKELTNDRKVGGTERFIERLEIQNPPNDMVSGGAHKH
jgi:hypothetical protein